MSAPTQCLFFFFSSRRRHTRCSRDWSSDVCSSDLGSSRGSRTGSLHARSFPRASPSSYCCRTGAAARGTRGGRGARRSRGRRPSRSEWRSEEHTSELQSRLHLVCRLLLEKKKKKKQRHEAQQPLQRH